MIFDGSSRRIGGRDGRNAIAAHPRDNVVALIECQDLSERHHKHFVAAGENRWPVRDEQAAALGRHFFQGLSRRMRRGR
jgi:hypothetical protein